MALDNGASAGALMADRLKKALEPKFLTPERPSIPPWEIVALVDIKSKPGVVVFKWRPLGRKKLTIDDSHPFSSLVVSKCETSLHREQMASVWKGGMSQPPVGQFGVTEVPYVLGSELTVSESTKRAL